MKKTREEFEATYNGGDIMPLLLAGRLSIQCRCNYEFCDGWKMAQLELLEDDVRFQLNTQTEVEEAKEHRLKLIDEFNLREIYLD